MYLCTINQNGENIPDYNNITKCLYDIPNGQGPVQCTQFGILGMKIYHLARLVWRMPLSTFLGLVTYDLRDWYLVCYALLLYSFLTKSYHPATLAGFDLTAVSSVAGGDDTTKLLCRQDCSAISCVINIYNAGVITRDHRIGSRGRRGLQTATGTCSRPNFHPRAP
jgi:hypothetical protein